MSLKDAMANKIVSNSNNCPFNVKECVSCYWSHVKDGQWTGSERCWEQSVHHDRPGLRQAHAGDRRNVPVAMDTMASAHSTILI